MLFEKVPLLLSREYARLPFLRGHRFILDRNSPNRYPFLLIGPDKFRVIVCPRRVMVRLQLAAAEHIIVVLHKRRWAPRASIYRELSTSGADGLLYHRNAVLPVMLD